MVAPSSFFIETDECDAGYKNVRDLSKPKYIMFKNYVESLWTIYAPYADKHFLSDATLHFQQRFWEMYLGCTFLAHNFVINRGGDKGPEFFLSRMSQNIWVEAIAPGPGDGPDAYALPRQQGD